MQKQRQFAGMAASALSLGTYSCMRMTSSTMAFELFTQKPNRKPFDRFQRGSFWPPLKQPIVTRSERKPKSSISMSMSNVNVLEKRRLQTQTVTSIAPDVTTVRSLDWDRDRFDMYVLYAQCTHAPPPLL